MDRRSQVGLLFACTSPDKHPTALALTLLATMPLHQSKTDFGRNPASSMSRRGEAHRCPGKAARDSWQVEK